MTSMRRSAQEAQRIALEQNLQQHDISLNFDSSVEYPRHLEREPLGAHGWTEDEHESEGIHPYAGETVSTAAHHASALTLSAGLRGHRRDASFATSASGAEYDPDRPVSLLNMDPVFDKSNDLDKLLQSGHQRSVRMRSPLNSYASDTESNRSFTARPKISDALRNNATFSPKRPSTLQSPSLRMEDNNPTPKPRRHHSGPSVPLERADIRLYPPTPSSKSARPFREATKDARDPMSSGKAAAPSPLRRGVLKSHSASRVHLPDVTGLTSAVESPGKGNLRHAQYAHGRARESEARLLAIISSVQTQLNDLERENGVSRRRVRELEVELDECKREVRRERDRVDELGVEAQRLRKGKARAREDEADVSVRYREVVEEKKALEALLKTLHAHLARLTQELQTHQRFLEQLRRLRESDAQVLNQRGDEIQNLRDEVARLGGEVEVLRGVVEDGLRERRERARNQQSRSMADTDMLIDRDEEASSEDDSEIHPFDPVSIPGSSRLNLPDTGLGHPVATEPDLADRTMRTDFATLGRSSAPPAPSSGQPFLDQEELDHISQEVEERRANATSMFEDSENEDSRPGLPFEESPSVIAASRKRERESSRRPNSSLPPRPSAPTPHHAATGRSFAAGRPMTPVRQSQPNQLQDAEDAEDDEDRRVPSPPPFPKIRGEHMERLFFTAPPHNAQTCKVCHRHRDDDTDSHDDNGDTGPAIRRANARLPSRRARAMTEAARGLASNSNEAGNDDWGDRSEGIDLENEPATRQWARQAKQQEIPPQTVVARVIRDLEDDFTHYKSIYVELADAYKVLDAASDIKRRNLLAKHLKEVIDILETKGDQIASLYELLIYRDRSTVANPGS